MFNSTPIICGIVDDMALTLYRRHSTACAKGYPQNERIFFPTTNKLRALDCECPITVEGNLGAKFLTNKSLRTTDWSEAHELAEKWEEWQATTPPTVEDDPENKTVLYAVESFLASIGPSGRNIETSSLKSYTVLLKQRLLPYCELKTYSLLREFDNLDVTTKFTESWVNLNPTKNRKDAPKPTVPVYLMDTTKKAQLELLRMFFTYCVDRKWLQTNQAKKIKVSTKTEAKFGMEPHEEEWFFAEVAKFTDGHYRTGQENALELKAACLAMRHAGLRISDVAKLDTTALVPRASGEGWAIKVYQKKTKEWVYIPIPAYVETLFQKLPIKGEKDGKRFWFWTGAGTQKSVINNLYMRIKKIVKRVEAENGKFTNSVSPHTFRHTFSIRHLNAGTDIKQVSKWLGHKHVSVTEDHYSHAIQGTKLASEEAYDVSMQKQEESDAKRKRLQLVTVNR